MRQAEVISAAVESGSDPGTQEIQSPQTDVTLWTYSIVAELRMRIAVDLRLVGPRQGLYRLVRRDGSQECDDLR